MRLLKCIECGKVLKESNYESGVCDECKEKKTLRYKISDFLFSITSMDIAIVCLIICALLFFATSDDIDNALKSRPAKQYYLYHDTMESPIICDVIYTEKMGEGWTRYHTADSFIDFSSAGIKVTYKDENGIDIIDSYSSGYMQLVD